MGGDSVDWSPLPDGAYTLQARVLGLTTAGTKHPMAELSFVLLAEEPRPLQVGMQVFTLSFTSFLLTLFSPYIL